MFRFITFALILVSLSACQIKPTQPTLSDKVEQYFTIYSQRTDFDAFLGFYSEDAVLEDLVYGNQVRGKAALRAFFRWESDPVKFEGGRSLVISEQVVRGNQVVTKGHFTEFEYQGQTMGPWRFVIWHEFNALGQIIRQEDWINYTPRESFLGGENLNKFTHENE